LEDIDFVMSKSLKWISQNSVEGLELTFTYERDFLGMKETIELVPDGGNVIITDENKKEYIRRVCEYEMKEEISEELAAFLKGFRLLIPQHFLDLFSPSEFQLLIAGIPDINMSEIRQHASYTDFEEDCNMVNWIWEILGEFSGNDLAAFVFFISGK